MADFFSREAGQERRAWLNALAADAMYYVPREMRPWLGVANELNPVTNMERAGTAANALADPDTSGWGRVEATGNMLSNMAAVAAPAIVASRAGVPASNALAEGMTGLSMTPQGMAAQQFVADEFGGLTLLPGQALDDALRAKYPGVKLSISGNPQRGYTLAQIVVPKEQRDAGIGTAIMRDLLEVADSQGATVALSPSADFGGSVPRLKEFYSRFGFVPNKGRNADYAISESMYRTAQNRRPAP